MKADAKEKPKVEAKGQPFVTVTIHDWSELRHMIVQFGLITIVILLILGWVSISVARAVGGG